ncbi:putative nucleic acid-binding protein [Kibdelosporangium banguiense]|uniref:Nucleic acid-binding protein n=1 Tax=Kibdelosporangium banguiense TaxID=1365924 RepID=A0ABS4T9V0_9PSEU|nr:type II toxin-antitoxin system VapC family toxin [Kibdelosporangium banguiense]MBP2320724.1 putative nucleic acid-binding protein [Kibdelosporangium banguiense]
MTVFADTSAVVKRYAKEPGQDLIRQIPILVVSQLARVEVSAALWGKERMGEISHREAAVLESLFEREYHHLDDGPRVFSPVRVTPVVLEAGARLARKHRLRGFDSIQLASAILAAETAPEITEFAAWDKRLREAAAAEGFALIPD